LPSMKKGLSFCAGFRHGVVIETKGDGNEPGDLDKPDRNRPGRVLELLVQGSVSEHQVARCRLLPRQEHRDLSRDQ
jgi:hypothetical protein